jgi:hypothetical protein
MQASRAGHRRHSTVRERAVVESVAVDALPEGANILKSRKASPGPLEAESGVLDIDNIGETD